MHNQKQEQLQQIRQELGPQLRGAGHLRRPEGIPTGLENLDQFLFWNGIPKGALTSLTGDLGLGATSLWLGSAMHVTRQGRWVAWVAQDAQLFPLTLWQKQLDLARLVMIEGPDSEKKLAWLLQELMMSTLFDLIGCDLGPLTLRDHQLRRLQTLARSLNTALIFFTNRRPLARQTRRHKSIQQPIERRPTQSLFALVIGFHQREIRIERALHRPTPYLIPRRITYANFTLHVRHRFGPDLPYFAGLKPRALPDSLFG